MPCPQPHDPAPAIAQDAPVQSVCLRCRTAPATVFFRESAYCLPCAKANFEQKAKPGLEAARGAGIAHFIARAATATATAIPAPAPSVARNDDREAVNASIALAWSGGISSRTLLRAAARYFRPEYEHERSAKPFVNAAAAAAANDDDGVASITSRMSSMGRTSEVAKVYVIFIDDSAILPDGRDRTKEARTIVESDACHDLFQFVGLKLEDVYRVDDDDDASSSHPATAAVSCSAEAGQGRILSRSVTSVEDDKAALRSLFASLHPEDTPRTGIASASTRTEDLHRILINYLLRREAVRRGCSALMLGESSTRMSIRLIESLAKGGGHKLPIEGSEAVWVDELLITRPLKPHLMQEVKFFAEANKLQWLPDQDLVPSSVPAGSAFNASGEPLMDKSSIGRLTETFILNLERGVPSTVSTISKTGSKLVLKSPDSDEPVIEPSPRATVPSVPAFQQVGPSVPLGRKARKAMTKEAASDGSSMVLEPRVGARGSRLAHVARNLPHWPARKVRRACPLCYMPAGAGAKNWKNEITISSLDWADGMRTRAEATRRGEEEEEDTIELASLLCYACILLLETPERRNLVRSTVHSSEEGAGSQSQSASMALPPFVLCNALHRLSTSADEKGDPEAKMDLVGGRQDGRADVDDTEDGVEASLDASADKERRQMAAAKGDGATQLPRKVDRQEMRDKIDEFLLGDGDGDDEEVHEDGQGGVGR